MEKTNALRLLDASNIKYVVHEYDNNLTNGQEIAKVLNKSEDEVFKTLVTVSNTKQHFVFVIPVNGTLNLKKAAKAVNVKSIEMIHQKELLPLTGYIHGGCSPIGMKKQFTTVIHETAQLFDAILVSAGKVGMNIEINPYELSKLVNATFNDVID
ncbi:MAG: Cys-tRNA(Pro) deacylase [Candidatus Caccosoma sp.]|nr:Cys-tRNA(Pro) deacylase [Candidatus Caccosoma sp.]